MDQQARRAVTPLGLRSHLLLVLAVLFGLVAMHGLGPGAVPASAAAPGCAAADETAIGHGTPVAGEHAMKLDPAVRADEPVGDGGSGHAQHADATCAAAGTAGTPVLASPAAALTIVTAAPVLDLGIDMSSAVGGRAPPSLSELQLLRV
ncbi:DUF6153 family protein [Streptomyces sp. SPB4]|uniref:DUF6153 family protein n=1 Tax=Streptomyces sp. SPB4 TaxID=2940553 RepID=UPI0024745B23|nr:DUF6153 family protein [Streptomyces sp. SPB4]MDH6537876.1 hypothetical protein [Streptomyces sp. SPB4]